MLHVEYIRDSKMAGQLQLIDIVIDLLDYLEEAYFVSTQFIVFSNWVSIFGQNSPYIIADLKNYLLSMLVHGLFLFGIIGFNLFFTD